MTMLSLGQCENGGLWLEVKQSEREANGGKRLILEMLKVSLTKSWICLAVIRKLVQELEEVVDDIWLSLE